MTTLMMVFSDPVAGREAEYDEWYDGTHLPELLALPGFLAAHRWRRSDAAFPGFAGCPHSNVAVYELDGDGEKGFAAMMEAAGSGALHMSEALDMGSVAMWRFDQNGSRQVAPS